jgi:hypothetical protein
VVPEPTTLRIRRRARAARTRCSTTSRTSTSRRRSYDNARKVYLELIHNWPNSKYIPNAYLAFGELFFNEAQGDPSKWALAEQSYSEVVKYPRPTTRSSATRTTSSAYVALEQGRLREVGISEFKKTIDFGVQYSQLPNAHSSRSLRVATSSPSTRSPAIRRRPTTSSSPLSGDTGVNRTTRRFKMMDDLGQNYLDTGHYNEGIALYQDLMNRDRGPKMCVYQGHITEATLAMKSGNKDQIIEASSIKQLEVHNKFVEG